MRCARRDGADALTRTVGAANTLRRTGDGLGSDEHGRRRIPRAARSRVSADRCAGARAAVLGAGGAARAVVVALASRGAQRHDPRAAARAGARDVAAGVAAAARARCVAAAAGSWDLLVNCTPLGGAGARDETPLPAGRSTARLVYDLTYGDERDAAAARSAQRRGA